MAKITLQGNSIETVGDLPKVGSKSADFKLVQSDLSEFTLNSLLGNKVVLNVFPSIDTEVCANSVRKFNEKAASMPNVKVLCISKDLPFAHSRFCGAEGIKDVTMLSDFRGSFGKDYGLNISTGALAGLHSRSIIVLDEEGKVTYTEQVPEITQDPNYEAAINAL